MSELKRKYEQAMKDVLHILGKYDYQYIKEYVEDLEKTFIQLEQSYDSLWDSVHSNPPLKFEELKVGMWVWDNNLKWYFEIGICKVQVEGCENLKMFKVKNYDDSLSLMIFEENRFYRKQVEE